MVTDNEAPGDGDGSPGEVKASRRGKKSAGDLLDPLIPETVVGKAQGRAPGPAWEALGPQQSHLIKRMTFWAV